MILMPSIKGIANNDYQRNHECFVIQSVFLLHLDSYASSIKEPL